jgi:hypothetical protein
MSGIYLDQPWTRQPQGAARPNRAIGVRSCFSMGAPKGFEFFNGAPIAPGPGGLAAVGNGSNRLALRTNPEAFIDPLNGWWVAVWFQRLSASQSAGQVVYCLASNASGSNQFVMVRVPASFGTTDGIVVGYRSRAGGGFYETGVGDAGATVVGGQYCLVGVCPPGTTLSSQLYIYLNGVRYAQVSSSGQPHQTPGGLLDRETILAASNLVDGTFLHGTAGVFAGGFGLGGISETLARDISLNPLLLFAPREIIIPYTAAAPALPTLTALARTNPRRPRYLIG